MESRHRSSGHDFTKRTHRGAERLGVRHVRAYFRSSAICGPSVWAVASAPRTRWHRSGAGQVRLSTCPPLSGAIRRAGRGGDRPCHARAREVSGRPRSGTSKPTHPARRKPQKSGAADSLSMANHRSNRAAHEQDSGDAAPRTSTASSNLNGSTGFRVGRDRGLHSGSRWPS
jgi:hypothetical protein